MSLLAIANGKTNYLKAATACGNAVVPSAAVYNELIGDYTCEPFLSQGSCKNGEWRVLKKYPQISAKVMPSIPFCTKRPCKALDEIPLQSVFGDCVKIEDSSKCNDTDVVRVTALRYGN